MNIGKLQRIWSQKCHVPGRSVLGVKLLWHKTSTADLHYFLSLPDFWEGTASCSGGWSIFQLFHPLARDAICEQTSAFQGATEL